MGQSWVKCESSIGQAARSVPFEAMSSASNRKIASLSASTGERLARNDGWEWDFWISHRHRDAIP